MRRFLNIAAKHTALLIDLCAEQEVISRSKLLNYLERHEIAPADKDTLIDELGKTLILRNEASGVYTMNPVVVTLVNYYERRGRLTHAGFLAERIHKIGKLTDELQRQLFKDEVSREMITDTVDGLYLLVREVREAGSHHYIACMRRFGDMKRSGEGKAVEQRLEELEKVQRRYINPLRDLIDPGADHVRKLAALKRRMADLAAKPELLARSRELDQRRQRLNIDLQFIDHILLRNFETVADTARTLLKSLLEEKNIKDAIAACLGNLETTWQYMKIPPVLVTGSQFSQAPGRSKVEDFFTDVVMKKLLPNPFPLNVPEVHQIPVDTIIIREDRILNSIRTEGNIRSWPEYVVHIFTGYSDSEQLRAMTLPLIASPDRIEIDMRSSSFSHTFNTFNVRMDDFGLTWKTDHDRQET